jgi:hypothetical protein
LADRIKSQRKSFIGQCNREKKKGKLKMPDFCKIVKSGEIRPILPKYQKAAKITRFFVNIRKWGRSPDFCKIAKGLGSFRLTVFG